MKLRDYVEIGIGLVLLGLIVGSFFYGVHVGKQDGAEALATAKTKWADSQNQALHLALKSQAAASASHIAALQAALSQANADNSAQAQDLSQARRAENTLKSRLSAFQSGSTAAAWLITPIPPGVTAALCTVDEAGKPSPQCP